MSVIATDNFNRADGGLGANWTSVSGTWSIVSNEVRLDASGSISYYSGAGAAPNDQYAQVVMGSAVGNGADSGCGPAVRINGSDLYFMAGGDTDTRVYKRISGGYTQLGSTGPSVAPGDVLYLEVQGTTLIAKKNGSSICGSPITDNAISSGNAGMWGYTDATFSDFVDDFEFGDFSGGGGAFNAVPAIYRYTLQRARKLFN